MTDINLTLEDNIGGWFNISVISLEEITECPEFLTNSNGNEFQYSPVASSLDILPVGENIKIVETIKKTKSGEMHNIKGEFEMVHESKIIDTYLKNYLYKKVVLIGVKKSGLKKLYGSKKFPLVFSYQYLHAKKNEESTKIKVTIMGQIPQNPIFLSN